jgi:hypothetical protein
MFRRDRTLFLPNIQFNLMGNALLADWRGALGGFGTICGLSEKSPAALFHQGCRVLESSRAPE